MTTAMPFQRRLYGVIRSDGAGRSMLHITATEPEPDSGSVYFIWQGIISDGLYADLPIVSDPTLDPTLRGQDGRMVGRLFSLGNGHAGKGRRVGSAL